MVPVAARKLAAPHLLAVVALLAGCSDRVSPGDGSTDTVDPACPHPAVTSRCQYNYVGGTMHTWCMIDPGCFHMGSPASELCRAPNEQRHRVTLTHRFETYRGDQIQQQFKGVTGSNPSRFSSCLTCGSNPVEQVTWHEAADYCNRLSADQLFFRCYSCTGEGDTLRCEEQSKFRGPSIYTCPGYRLPTEAEWEYAARAGTTTATYNGDLTSCKADSVVDAIGWYAANSKSETHPAAFEANGWGLYDMSGNVAEWANDWYQDNLGEDPVTDPGGPTSGTLRVVRGGSWAEDAGAQRSARRAGLAPETRSDRVGFRCIRTLTP